MTQPANIKVGRDANDNIMISGDGNVVIVQAMRTFEVASTATATQRQFGPNPYRGLEIFREEHADRFFGREELTQKLWIAFRDLHGPVSGPAPLRLLPIIGPSGSGKSSLARAGLVAELARNPLPGRSATRVGVITPGTHPIESLALVLARIATNDQTPVAKTSEFAQRLRQKAPSGAFDGLRFIADLLPEITTKPIVILVDQFEETYSLCDDTAERDVFIDTLLHAAGAAGARVSIILTLRTDFVGATNRHAQLSQALAARAVLVPVMGEKELRSAIQQPAINAGHPIDAATVDLLVAETAGREGALPLLQFVLTRIWDGMAKDVSPAQTVRDLGGVGGALAKEAQLVYEKLSKLDQRIARRAFLAMVRLGEGTLDTRRRASLPEIVGQGEKPESVLTVLRMFSQPDKRLVTLSAEAESIGTAEVTHEALLEDWSQLREWLKTGRDDIRFHRRLSEAGQHWEAKGRPQGLLWRPPDLDELRKYRAKDDAAVDLTAQQVEFHDASERELRLDHDASERQLRFERRVRHGFMAVALGVAAVFVLGSSRLYSNWELTRPWARFTDLATGQTYLLSQDSAFIGRPTEGVRQIRTQVGLSSQRVSRIHMAIFNTGMAMDWRSLYGTTVNGQPLVYGESQQLEPGDILVLSGLHAFAYRPIEWRPWDYFAGASFRDEAPLEGWAMLVDGERRVVLPIGEDEQYVTVGSGIALSDRQTADAVLVVRRRVFRDHAPLTAQRIDVIESSDGAENLEFAGYVIGDTQNPCSTGEPTVAVLTLQTLGAAKERVKSWLKQGDYNYVHISLPVDAETIALIDLVGNNFLHGLGDIVFETDSGRFQLVPTQTTDVGEICARER